MSHSTYSTLNKPVLLATENTEQKAKKNKSILVSASIIFKYQLQTISTTEFHHSTVWPPLEMVICKYGLISVSRTMGTLMVHGAFVCVSSDGICNMKIRDGGFSCIIWYYFSMNIILFGTLSYDTRELSQGQYCIVYNRINPSIFCQKQEVHGMCRNQKKCKIISKQIPSFTTLGLRWSVNIFFKIRQTDEEELCSFADRHTDMRAEQWEADR